MGRTYDSLSRSKAEINEEEEVATCFATLFWTSRDLPCLSTRLDIPTSHTLSVFWRARSSCVVSLLVSVCHLFSFRTGFTRTDADGALEHWSKVRERERSNQLPSFLPQRQKEKGEKELWALVARTQTIGHCPAKHLKVDYSPTLATNRQWHHISIELKSLKCSMQVNQDDEMVSIEFEHLQVISLLCNDCLLNFNWNQRV